MMNFHVAWACFCNVHYGVHVQEHVINSLIDA